VLVRTEQVVVVIQYVSPKSKLENGLQDSGRVEQSRCAGCTCAYIFNKNVAPVKDGVVNLNAIKVTKHYGDSCSSFWHIQHKTTSTTPHVLTLGNMPVKGWKG
jgi:hypothetical protein